MLFHITYIKFSEPEVHTITLSQSTMSHVWWSY